MTGPGTPTGTVTFTDGGTALGTVALDGSGKATLTTSSFAIGSQPIVANYSGSADFLAATSETTTVAIARAGAQVILVTQAVHRKKKIVSLSLKATVEPVAPGAGVPAGTVIFEMTKKKKVKVLGTAALSGGSATLAVKPNAVLKKSITILYGGDTAFLPSTSTAVVSKSKAAVSVPLVTHARTLWMRH